MIAIVQGTTIGIKKSIFNKIGGLGEWTSGFFLCC